MSDRPVAPSDALFWRGVAETGSFFTGDSPIHRALTKLARVLDEASIPYAFLGAMALNAHGYRRATADVDVLLTREGLDALKARVPLDLAGSLDPSVRDKYVELWHAAQAPSDER